MPAPVGDCSTPPRGIFFESGKSALTVRQPERRVLAGALVGELLLPFGRVVRHFAISMHQAGGPHPYQGRVRPDLSAEVGQLSTAIRGAT